MIVIVLRHADRQPGPVDDLTPAGCERAELLARMLAESGVTAAFHSGAERARLTLEPLRQRLGAALTVEAVGSGDPDATAAAVRQLPTDAVVAVVGHSNTVPPIIEKLGGGPADAIGPDVFDRLFILLVDPGGATTLLRLRYGAAT